MRRYLAALALLALPAALLAQGGRERGGRGFGAGPSPVEFVLEHRSDLNLSADQVTKLEAVASQLEQNNKPIIAEMQKNRPANRQEMTEQQREEMRSVMEKLRDNRQDAEKQMAAILTQDQKTKLESFRPERRERAGRRENFGGFAQRSPIQSILQHRSELALSTDQVSRLQSIASTLDQRNQPILSKLKEGRKAGTRPQDLTEAQRNEMRSAMEKLHQNNEAALNEARALLSKEQQEKLKTIQPARGERGLGGRHGGFGKVR